MSGLCVFLKKIGQESLSEEGDPSQAETSGIQALELE